MGIVNVENDERDEVGCQTKESERKWRRWARWRSGRSGRVDERMKIMNVFMNPIEFEPDRGAQYEKMYWFKQIFYVVMMNIHDKANRMMNPLCLSSLLFGCIGTLLYTSTYRTEGCGMIVVSITSLLYHKTYYSVFRIMDGLSNGALMMFFCWIQMCVVTTVLFDCGGYWSPYSGFYILFRTVPKQNHCLIYLQCIYQFS